MALNEGKKINHNNLFREMLTEHTAKTKGFFPKNVWTDQVRRTLVIRRKKIKNLDFSL